MPQNRAVNTLILGAGAAGMMAAAHAGPDVLVIDHAKAPGEKIRISGGGRCNFTNMDVTPANYLSENTHFCKSALARYTQWDFIELVSRHGIAWHEKTLGQLFCDDKATQIIDMLLAEMRKAKADLWLRTSVKDLTHRDGAFHATLEREGQIQTVVAKNLVLATGGKSIPKMGATGLAYDIARQFDHAVTETRPALVPFTFDKGRFADLAGVAVDSTLSNDRARFAEALLFTHRGLSGPCGAATVELLARGRNHPCGSAARHRCGHTSENRAPQQWQTRADHGIGPPSACQTGRVPRRRA